MTVEKLPEAEESSSKDVLNRAEAKIIISLVHQIQDVPEGRNQRLQSRLIEKELEGIQLFAAAGGKLVSVDTIISMAKGERDVEKVLASASEVGFLE